MIWPANLNSLLSILNREDFYLATEDTEIRETTESIIFSVVSLISVSSVANKIYISLSHTLPCQTCESKGTDRQLTLARQRQLGQALT